MSVNRSAKMYKQALREVSHIESDADPVAENIREVQI